LARHFDASKKEIKTLDRSYEVIDQVCEKIDEQQDDEILMYDEATDQVQKETDATQRMVQGSIKDFN
jgi:hypothetical protein